MRRPLGVGLVLLSLPVLLPGVSGCAGLPQRLSLSSPRATGSDGTETPASSLISWWRGSGSKASSSTEVASNSEDNGKAATPSGGAYLPGDVWPESRSEWLARQFPFLSRGWNANRGERVRDGVDPSVRSQGSAVSARSDAARDPSTARADDDVRPVQATSGDDSANSGGVSVRGQSERYGQPRIPSLWVGTRRPHSLPEVSGDVELDVSSWGSPEAERCSSEDDPLELLSAPKPSPEPDSARAQVPPAPKPRAQLTPPPPPFPGGERPAATPTQSEEPASSGETEAKPQPSQASAPPSGVAPAPGSPQSQASAMASGPRLLTATGQSNYASPPPVAPPEPRGKFLSWLHPERQAEPLASPQLPPATFPTTYRLNAAVAMPVKSTPQSDAGPGVTAASAVKKPCVLTGLFRKLTSWGHGSSCGGCQRDRSPSCCHGCTCCAGKNSTVSGSPQRTAASLPGPAGTLRGPLAPLVALVRSRGTEPGDVAQGGKVFDSAVSQSLDESSQR